RIVDVAHPIILRDLRLAPPCLRARRAVGIERDHYAVQRHELSKRRRRERGESERDSESETTDDHGNPSGGEAMLALSRNIPLIIKRAGGVDERAAERRER